MKQFLKQKIKFSPQKNTAHRDHESSGKKRILSAPEKRRAVGYQKHLFSDTSGQTDSSGHSERSWILEHQKRPLSKSADYSRKRSRVRSKLKVLPSSSESSHEEYKKKNTVNASKYVSATPQKEANTKNLSVPGRQLPGVSVLLTPGDLYDKSTVEEHHLDGLETADSLHALDGVSSPEYSGASEKMEEEMYIQMDRSSTQDIVSGAKQENSDLSAGRILKKVRRSRSESNDEETPDSSERKNKRQTGLYSAAEINLAEQNDVFYDGEQEEESSAANVIAMFDQFTKDLKKKVLSRPKKMKLHALETFLKSTYNLSSQLDEYRLKRLDQFHETVVQDQQRLEKEDQELMDLENDTMDFLNKRKLKLKAFCDEEKQRLKNMCSHVEEIKNTLEEEMQQIVTAQCGFLQDEKILEHTEENFEALYTTNETA